MLENKTYKREVAFLMLLYLMYLGLYGTVAVLEVLAWPFMFFVAAAFGMEWSSKQTDLFNKGSSKDEKK